VLVSSVADCEFGSVFWWRHPGLSGGDSVGANLARLSSWRTWFGLAVVREMGPMMAAVVVAGGTGAGSQPSSAT